MDEAKAWVMSAILNKDKTGCVLDMRPLVFCKDCKYWDDDDHECITKIGWFSCGADWFCADGERKDDDA